MCFWKKKKTEEKWESEENEGLFENLSVRCTIALSCAVYFFFLASALEQIIYTKYLRIYFYIVDGLNILLLREEDFNLYSCSQVPRTRILLYDMTLQILHVYVCLGCVLCHGTKPLLFKICCLYMRVPKKKKKIENCKCAHPHVNRRAPVAAHSAYVRMCVHFFPLLKFQIMIRALARLKLCRDAVGSIFVLVIQPELP